MPSDMIANVQKPRTIWHHTEGSIENLPSHSFPMELSILFGPNGSDALCFLNLSFILCGTVCRISSILMYKKCYAMNGMAISTEWWQHRFASHSQTYRKNIHQLGNALHWHIINCFMDSNILNQMWQRFLLNNSLKIYRYKLMAIDKN